LSFVFKRASTFKTRNTPRYHACKHPDVRTRETPVSDCRVCGVYAEPPGTQIDGAGMTVWIAVDPAEWVG